MKVKILVNATDKEYATFNCPKYNLFGIIDKEQYEGKISIQCPNCDFHKTIDFRQVKKEGR